MRNHDVTIAKALAIILMVLGHAGGPELLNNYLSLMRMPLFFFMSGYCFKNSYLDDSKTYMRKRIKGVYWPYVKWTLVFVLFHNVFFKIGIYNDTFLYNGHLMHEYTITETLRKMFDGALMRGTERLLGGFWFLKSLFYGGIIFYAAKRFISNAWIGALLLLVITFLFAYFHVQLPLLLIVSRDFFAAFFIMTGYIAKNTSVKGSSLSDIIIANKSVIIIFALCIGVGCVYWPTSMLFYQWHQVIPYATTAIMGTFVLFSIGHFLNANCNGFLRDFLIYTGGYTFNVLTWHFLSFKVVTLLIIVIYNLPMSHLGDFPVVDIYASKGWWILYVMAGVTLPLAWKYVTTTWVKRIIQIHKHNG